MPTNMTNMTIFKSPE